MIMHFPDEEKRYMDNVNGIEGSFQG